MRVARGWPQPSDHVPVTVDLETADGGAAVRVPVDAGIDESVAEFPCSTVAKPSI